MRPVIAAVIWIVLVGGLTMYMESRETIAPAAAYHPHIAGGVFALRITTTLPLEPDPFALRTGQREAPSLLVKLNGNEILRKTSRIRAGTSIEVAQIHGLIAGLNEFYLVANPPAALTNHPNAVRVQVFQDHRLIVDRSFWTEPGLRIAAAFQVSVTGKSAKDHHD